MENPLSTRAALLQALRAGPGYGLDLIGRVERMTSGLVRLRQGAVYPALRALEGERLLTRWTVVPGGRRGGRSRTYYELTTTGSALAESHRRAFLGCSVMAAPRLAKGEILRMRERLRRGAELSLFAIKLRGRARRS
jgi:DNA-binding PadR family transcriptional regulator